MSTPKRPSARAKPRGRPPEAADGTVRDRRVTINLTANESDVLEWAAHLRGCSVRAILLRAIGLKE